MLRLRIGESGHIGRVRPVNQDASLAAADLAAVADGMGGHAAGEVASRTALEALADAFSGRSTQELVAGVEAANAAVFEQAGTDPELAGMGTTLTALGLVRAGPHPVLALVNVGDSRTYRVHQGDLEQLTLDHSLVETMVRAGNLTPEEARIHPQRNILTRALGIDATAQVDAWELPAEAGDRYLLCSDGLFNELDEHQIAAVLRRLADPQEAAEELVRLAVAAGGRDNVTAVVVDVTDEDGEAAGTPPPAHDDEHPAEQAPAPDSEPAAPEPAPATDATTGSAGASTASPAGRVTWRTALFVGAFLGVLAAASAAVWWYARGTYYVGVSSGQVAIFQGRPGSVLWLEPTLAETTALALDDVPEKYVADLEEGRLQPSLDDARAYVARIEAEAEDLAAATTTTTSTTTTTTTPPAAAPTTTVALSTPPPPAATVPPPAPGAAGGSP